MDMLAQGALQTPTFKLAEALLAGLNVSLIDSLGGFTPNTDWRMRIAPGGAGSRTYRAKKFTIDATPSSFWSFGFPVRFSNVDIAAGKANFIFWSLVRNGLPDVSLELQAHASGHELNLLDANGVTQGQDVNTFTEDTDHWIEVGGDHTVMFVDVDDINVFTDISDYKGDATGDQQAYFEFYGQVDLSPDSSSTEFYFGPWYAAENISGAADFLGKTGHEVYAVRHIDATANKGCDEVGNSPGNAEDLNVGNWDDAADDAVGTFAQYTGDGIATIGSAKEMGGPAPSFRPSDAPTGCKYVFITTGDPGGTYKVGHGSRASSSGNYQLTTLSIGDRRKYTEIWGLPDSGTFPKVPDGNELAVGGHFVESPLGLNKKLKAHEMFLFVFGPQGMALNNWPVDLVQREHMCRGIGRGFDRGIGR